MSQREQVIALATSSQQTGTGFPLWDSHKLTCIGQVRQMFTGPVGKGQQQQRTSLIISCCSSKRKYGCLLGDTQVRGRSHRRLCFVRDFCSIPVRSLHITAEGTQAQSSGVTCKGERVESILLKSSLSEAMPGPGPDPSMAGAALTHVECFST